MGTRREESAWDCRGVSCRVARAPPHTHRERTPRTTTMMRPISSIVITAAIVRGARSMDRPIYRNNTIILPPDQVGEPEVLEARRMLDSENWEYELDMPYALLVNIYRLTAPNYDRGMYEWLCGQYRKTWGLKGTDLTRLSINSGRFK